MLVFHPVSHDVHVITSLEMQVIEHTVWVVCLENELIHNEGKGRSLIVSGGEQRAQLATD